MLRTNLSTRPFYNERVVQLALWAAALVVAGLTLFNAVELRLLTTRQGQLLGRVRADERRAAALRTDADRARRSVDRARLETVATAAGEANRLIDRRTFSWTQLLSRIEATIPADVRIQSIRPAAEREEGLVVSMIVLGHRQEDIEQFVEQLEATGAFQRVYVRSESTNQQGLLEVAVEGRYEPATGNASPAPAEAPSARTPAAKTSGALPPASPQAGNTPTTSRPGAGAPAVPAPVPAGRR